MKIHQKDIFKLLNRRGGGLYDFSQSTICKMLNKIALLSITPSRLSEVKSGKRKGYIELANKENEMYDTFFAEHAPTPEKAQVALDALIDYIKKENLDFGYSAGKPNDTYEKYVKRMLMYALPQCDLPKPAPEEDTPQPTAQVSGPALRCQHFCHLKNFIGREELLNEITAHLQEKHAAVLCGLGGIGKTYLSREYASQHSDEYTAVQCVLCRDAVPSFRRMILDLQFDHLDEQKWSEEERFQYRMEYLKKAEPSLLIFDNVDGIPENTDVFNQLVHDSRLHILVTTRTTAEFLAEYKVPVPPLDQGEQIQLFEHHLGAAVEDDDLPTVKEILQHIGGHTLLIELIAKSIDKGDFTFGEMLDILQEGMVSGELPKVPVQKDGQFTPDELGHFVHKILFNIDPLPPEQQDTLRFLSLLPTDGISRRLFKRYLAPNHDQALLDLESKGWVMKEKRSSDNITKLHPVIRDVAKKNLCPTCENCRLFLKRLCDFLSGAEASDYTDDLCRLIPSLETTIDFAAEPSEANLHDLHSMAEFCRSKYHYGTALKLYNTGLRLCQNAGEQPFPQNTLYKLYIAIGELYQRLAQYSDAIHYFEDSIAYTVDDTEQQAKAYRNLGEVYRKDSRYEQALDYDQKALEIFKKISENGKGSDIAEATNAIGVVYLNMGMESAAANQEEERTYYRKAKEHYEEALDLYQQCNAPVDQLAFSTHNLGTAYYRLEEYSKAVEYHQKGLKIRQENFLDKTVISASLGWLGNDYTELGQYDKAKEYLDQSLSIRKAILGENHPDYAWALNSLSRWYEKTGALDKAIEIMHRVIDIRKNALGPDHQYTREAVSRLEELEAKTQNEKTSG